MENKDKKTVETEEIFQIEEQDLSDFSSEKEMEDIVSDTHYAKKGRHYKKKPGKFRRWWRGLKKWKRITIVTTSIILALLIIVGTVWGVLRWIYYRNVYDDDFNDDNLAAVGTIDKNVINIALFGIDTRSIALKGEQAFKGLSDSIMIMSLNTKTKTVKIISVMRDSLVPIDELDKNKQKTGTTYTKINAAYAKGGPELAVRTLNQVFKLDIRDYATVNFAGMADIIDAVGGIDVTLADGELDVYGYERGRRINWGLNGLIEDQCRMLGKNPKGLYIKKGGTYHLNGMQAVAYARIRHAANADGTNDDYGRTDRQRYVMEQLFNKAIKMKKSQYAGLAKAMLPCCKTSLEFEEVVALAKNVLASSPTFEQTRVPLTDYQMSSRVYVYYDLNYARKLVHAFIYDNISPEDYMKQNGIEQNDWYAQVGGGSYIGNGNNQTTTSSAATSQKSSTNTETKKNGKTEESESETVEEGTESGEQTSEPGEQTSEPGEQTSEPGGQTSDPGGQTSNPGGQTTSPGTGS